TTDIATQEQAATITNAITRISTDMKGRQAASFLVNYGRLQLRPTRHNQLGSEDLQYFCTLIAGFTAHSDQALLWFGTGRNNLYYFAEHLQNVARTRGPWPFDLATRSDNATGQRRATTIEQLHG